MRSGGAHRGGRGGGSGLSASPTTGLLRPALEAAVAVARAGERATPPVRAPQALARYLRFARLPDPALEIARKVLDGDEAFRRRVAGSTDEGQVGRAGWLWLDRPAGWEAEFEALRKQANAAEVAHRDERMEREAQRRLAGAENALARVETRLVAATEEAALANEELERERRLRAAATEEVLALRTRVEELLDERSAAIRSVKGSEARVADRNAEVRELRHQIRMLAVELDDATGGRRGAGPGREAPVEAGPVEAEPAGPAPEVVAAERAALASAVDAARTAAAQLTESLASAAALVGPPAPAAASDPGGGAGPARPPRPRPAARPRRVPLRLPPGLPDDGPEVAEHLVRAPDVLLLVDGYNVSQSRWPELPIAEQRTRLLDACVELHVRTGAQVEVIFDGDGDEPATGVVRRGGVRYAFTPAGVEADDVLLHRAADEPLPRPVVVASSDGRVRDGARRAGANVLSAAQCLVALRRG